MTAGPPPAPARHEPSGMQVLVGALLVLGGVGWLLDAAGVAVPWRALLPAALIAVGAATVAGAWRGRQHGLILVGLALAVVVAAASATGWSADVGDRTERPVAASSLATYRLAVGNLTVDLRGMAVPDGTTVVRATVGIGELRVAPPAGVALEVDGHAGIGQVHALDREEAGVGSRLRASSADFAANPRKLVLDVRVGLGQVEVDG